MKSDDVLQFCIPVLIGLTLRSAVLLHPHSGQGKPPMYGDYEAQRHWMEITINLPTSDWYFNSTVNDLNYWGLDYPPLTAYHSWILGKISNRLNPSWTQLISSRGMETYDHKVFMRYTVLLADILVFMPSVLYYFYFALPRVTSEQKILPFYSCCLAFLYPGLILIDHGHFQYNCISLGLFVLALGLILSDHEVLGTVTFCLALGYKQMELYHSLPLFCYLLGKCMHRACSAALLQLVKLTLSVVLTLAAIFAPFLTDRNSIVQVVHRLFPISRGLYEDKVANFWCTTSPLVKWSTFFSHIDLIRLCTVVVLIANIPACGALLFKPTKHRLLLSLASSSMAFYLFSYQVHEKSILLVAITALCLMPLHPFSFLLFGLTSTLSMWPLFVKDQLILACLCTSLIFFSVGFVVVMRRSCLDPSEFLLLSPNTLLLLPLSGFGLLFLAQAVWTPPPAYPDLYALLISAFSCVQFMVFFLFWNFKVFTVKGV